MKLILEVDDPEAALFEIVGMVIKLRYYSKYWEENFGCRPKERKKHYEAEVDEWLVKHIKEEEKQ